VDCLRVRSRGFKINEARFPKQRGRALPAKKRRKSITTRAHYRGDSARNGRGMGGRLQRRFGGGAGGGKQEFLDVLPRGSPGSRREKSWGPIRKKRRHREQSQAFRTWHSLGLTLNHHMAAVQKELGGNKNIGKKGRALRVGKRDHPSRITRRKKSRQPQVGAPR